MNIEITIKEENTMIIIQEVMAYFAERFPEKVLKWSVSDGFMSTEADVNYEEITVAFETLIHKYKNVDVKASYSYSEKEGDGSADWWGVVTVY